MRVTWAGLIHVCLAAWLHAAEPGAPFLLSVDEQAIVDQTNAQRQRAGLSALRPNATLFEIARKHAGNMAAQDKLEHRIDGKSSSDRADAAGYQWTTVSENIAWNQRTVPEVMDGWMRSSGHRTNLMGHDISEMGAAVAANAKGELYWVQVFAQPEHPDRRRNERPIERPVARPAERPNARPRYNAPEPTPPSPHASAPVVASERASGAIQFSIQNVSGEELSVDVHADKAAAIKPGETLSFGLTTPGIPLIAVKLGISTLEFKVQTGARYTINRSRGGLELTQGDPEAR